MSMQTNKSGKLTEFYIRDFCITTMLLFTQEVWDNAALEGHSQLKLVLKTKHSDGMDGLNNLNEYKRGVNNIVDDANLQEAL